MKKYFLFLMLLSSINAFSQDSGWSEPVQISKFGFDYNFDITIDHNNLIHIVWCQLDNLDFRKIFYANSEDDGKTWSAPEDISLNTDDWADHPQICVDSKNNVYIIYSFPIGDGLVAKLLFTKFDGDEWSSPINIALDYQSVEWPRITIDNNDRIYVFWQYWQDGTWGNIAYRFLEDTVWSDVCKPYNGDYKIKEAIADANNNLHCVGQFRNNGEDEFGYKAAYFKYDYTSSNWQDKKVMSDIYNKKYIDIDLDSKNRPHIVWEEYYRDTIPPRKATLYAFNDGLNWSIPQQIGIADADFENPTIALDEDDNTHIVIRRMYHFNYPRYSTLKYYKGLSNCIKFDSAAYIGNVQIKHNKNSLYLIYDKEVVDDSLFVYFRKNELTTDIRINKSNQTDFHVFQNYPNPFNNSTIIQYNLKELSKVEISIYDIKGSKVKVLLNEIQQPGFNTIAWNGCDEKGRQVSSGLYLYKINAGNYSVIRKMVLVQ